ncbi:U3 small nucleolar RNA-associated protein 1 (UTP1) [Vairimorpha necatrix]|uniref:U3 small nucleolar RNA-associated protein 1 (UTP1) n=1 Tax=Vairimorpha necatrix TaxID=6039 RepID=A0AAX4JFL5_9MICR
MSHYSLKMAIPTESPSRGLICTKDKMYFTSNTFIFSLKNGEYKIEAILENYIKKVKYKNSLLYAITEKNLIIIYKSKNIASLKCNPSCLKISEKFIILACENTLETWYTPKEYKFNMFNLHSKIQLHNQNITCINLINQNTVISGSKDCSVKIYNLKSKKIDKFINTKSIPIKIFKIEKYICVICEEGQIYYVNLETKKIDHKIFKNTNIIDASCYENLICICLLENKKNKFEIISKKEVIYSVETKYSINEISLEDKKIAFKGQNIVGIYNYELDTYIFILDLPKISCLDISNDLFCVGCTDKKIRLYDDKKILKIFYDEKNSNPLLDVYFLSGSILSLSNNGYISLFDMKNGVCYRSFNMPVKISASSICDDGMMLFIADYDNYKIRIIDLQRSKEIESLIGHESPVKKMVYYKNFLFSLSNDNELRKWEIYKNQCDMINLEKSATNFIVRKNKIFVSFYDEIIEYDMDLEYVNSVSFKNKKPAEHLDLTFDGKMLLLGGEFNKLNILDIETNTVEQTVKVSRNTKWKNYKDNLYKNQIESCDKSEIVEILKLIHSKNQYQFTYLSREGVFTYNWSSSKYLPLFIDLESTTEALSRYLENKKFLNALIVALKLNEMECLEKLIDIVPEEEVFGIVKMVPSTFIEKLRIFLINQINDNKKIVGSYMWMRWLIFNHGKGNYEQKVCKKTGEMGYKSTIENIFIFENLI